VTDGEDAAMQPVQTPVSPTQVDRALAEAGVAQLRERDHAVLPERELRHGDVRRGRGGRWSHASTRRQP